MEPEIFLLETDEGQYTCEVLLRFYLEEYQKNYLIYTDHTKDQEGDENIFVSSYLKDDETNTLQDITDPKELEKIIANLEVIWGENDGSTI